MRVVVVGATGNVGTSLVRSLGGEPAVEADAADAGGPGRARELAGGVGERP